MKVNINKSVVKAIMFSILIIFSVEFTFQRIMLSLIKEHSYEQMNKCLLGDEYDHKNILKNKELFKQNSKNINVKVYDSLLEEIEAKEEANECLINYIYERNETAQKNISSYLYTIFTLIVILSFSSIISFMKKSFRKE